MKCTHDAAEMDTAAHADGLCPLCLAADNNTMRMALEEIAWKGIMQGYSRSHLVTIANKVLREPQ